MAERRAPPYVLSAASGPALGVTGALLDRPARSAPVFDVGVGTIRPGLINAHDHLQLNHYPRLGQGPYANAYDWGHDIHARFGGPIERSGRLAGEDAYLFGALKNLLGGVTAVVQHDPWDPGRDATFPVRVVCVRVAHSLRFERDLVGAARGDPHTADRPLSMHVAEGTDDAAAAEVPELSRLGLLDKDLLAVHLVGVDEVGVRLLRGAGAAMVTCPTSNRFLLGRLPPLDLFRCGIDVLLGTDSLLTAEGTMLEEAAAALREGILTAAALEASVGASAARRLRLPPPDLRPGSAADLVVLRRPLGEATPADVALVVVAGIPRLGDRGLRPLFEHCGVRCEALRVGGVEKLVEAPLATVAARAVATTPEVARILEERSG